MKLIKQSIFGLLAWLTMSVATANPIYKVVTPFPPGGTNDNMARLVSKHLQDAGIANVVHNRPGANGLVGMRSVLAENDPHMLLVLSTGPGLLLPLTGEGNYDVLKEFEPITGLVTGPSVVIVPAKSSHNTLADLVTALKANRLPPTWAVAGPHARFEGARFLQTIGGTAVEVPFNGSAPATIGVASGDVDFAVIDFSSTVREMAASGRLRILAIGSKKRLPSLPDVRTFTEQGINFESNAWFLLMGRKGMSATDVTRINKIVTEGLTRDPANTLIGTNNEIFPLTPRQTAEYLQQQYNIMRPVVERMQKTVK